VAALSAGSEFNARSPRSEDNTNFSRNFLITRKKKQRLEVVIEEALEWHTAVFTEFSLLVLPSHLLISRIRHQVASLPVL
jgi:hypothetical protein